MALEKMERVVLMSFFPHEKERKRCVLVDREEVTKPSIITTLPIKEYSPKSDFPKASKMMRVE